MMTTKILLFIVCFKLCNADKIVPAKVSEKEALEVKSEKASFGFDVGSSHAEINEDLVTR